MKRNREIYKLGRMMMNATRVPMTSNSSGVTVNLHYKKDMVLNYPVKNPDGTYGNGTHHIKAGQLRMRRAKTAKEVEQYYGLALNNAVDSAKGSLEASGFSDPISYAYASSSASSASSASASIASEENISNDANTSDNDNMSRLHRE